MAESNFSAVYSHVEIDGIHYPYVFGVIFRKPGSDTLLTSLNIPARVEGPNLKVGQIVTMSFRIEFGNYPTNRNVLAEVNESKRSPGGGKVYYLLIRQRKPEPPSNDDSYDGTSRHSRPSSPPPDLLAIL